MSEKPDLVTFLAARYDELEAATIYYRDRHPGLPCTNLDKYHSCSLHIAAAKATPYSNAEFGLADIAAKRRILALHDDDGWNYCPICLNPDDSDLKALTPCEHLRLLAAPFAQHPDYDPAWVIE